MSFTVDDHGEMRRGGPVPRSRPGAVPPGEPGRHFTHRNDLLLPSIPSVAPRPRAGRQDASTGEWLAGTCRDVLASQAAVFRIPDQRRARRRPRGHPGGLGALIYCIQTFAPPEGAKNEARQQTAESIALLRKEFPEVGVVVRPNSLDTDHQRQRLTNSEDHSKLARSLQRAKLPDPGQDITHRPLTNPEVVVRNGPGVTLASRLWLT
jgi:hypothetical protein